MTQQISLTIETNGRELRMITEDVRRFVRDSGVDTGLCNVFCQHTSASLIINENADPSVQVDLQSFFSRLVEDDDPIFTHRDEGPDDMSAHIRAALTSNSLNIPITNGDLALGTWQGIFLWEHRTHPHRRKIVLTAMS